MSFHVGVLAFLLWGGISFHGETRAVDALPKGNHFSGLIKPFSWGGTSLASNLSKRSSLSKFESLSWIRGGEQEGDTSGSQATSLYHPGLLKCKIRPRGKEITLSSDCSVTLSKSKAAELNVGSGDVVGLVGRRRRVSYAVVEVSSAKMPKSECRFSANLAENIRLRDGDAVKLVLLGSGEETEPYHFGEMQLLSIDSHRPKHVSSVTIAPIADSLLALEGAEADGDEIAEEEIIERFLQPYFASGGTIKEGLVLTLYDENGKKLDVQLSHVTLSDEDGHKNNKEGKDRQEEGM
jgi:hypothetical protein